MRARFFIILAAASFAALIGVGCDLQSDSITSALESDDVEALPAEADALSKFFTGRDSFGVALKIRFAGEAVLLEDGRCPDVTVVLSGSGHATHLGVIEGELSHCAAPEDLSSFSDGQFLFSGATGGSLSGAYPPRGDDVVIGKHGPRDSGDGIVTKAAVTGGDVSAVLHEPLEGRGDLHILLKSDGSFVQTFDGWLLHHLADE